MTTTISALGGMDLQTLYQYLGQAGNNLTADQQQQLLTIATTSLQQQYEQQVQSKAQQQLQQIQQKKQQQPPKKKQKKQHNVGGVGGANGSFSNGASSPQMTVSNGAPSPSLLPPSLPPSISITPSHQLKAPADSGPTLPQNLSTSVSSNAILSQQLNSPISITPAKNLQNSVSITPSPNIHNSVSITPSVSVNPTPSVSVNPLPPTTSSVHPLPPVSNSVSITPSQQSNGSTIALTPSQQQLLLSNGTSLTSVANSGNSQQNPPPNGTTPTFQNKHLQNGTPNAKSDSRSSTPSRPSAPSTPITLPPLAQAMPQASANPLTDVGQTKYQQLLAVIEEMAKDLRPCYSASKQSAERLKRGIVYARILVRECLNETNQSNKN